MAAPLLWTLLLSLKPNDELLRGTQTVFSPPYTLRNYADILGHSAVFGWLLNSAIVSLAVTFGVLVLSSLALWIRAPALSRVQSDLYHRVVWSRHSRTIGDHRPASDVHAAIVRRRLRERGVRSVPRGPNEATRANPAGLTSKELEVLQLLAQGCSSAQLARRLHRSPKTVDHHVCSLLEKLGVHSRTEAVAAAYARGIVSVHQPTPTQPAD